MQSLLVGVTPKDPLTLGVSVLVLVMVGGLACWMPARRAAAMPPLGAMTDEE